MAIRVVKKFRRVKVAAGITVDTAEKEEKETMREFHVGFVPPHFTFEF